MLAADHWEQESLYAFVGVDDQKQKHFKELDKDIKRLSTATGEILERNRPYWFCLGVLADMLYRRGRLSESHDDLALARLHIKNVIKALPRTDKNYEASVGQLLIISCEIHKTEFDPRAAALDEVRSVVGELPDFYLKAATNVEHTRNIRPGLEAFKAYLSTKDPGKLNFAMEHFKAAGKNPGEQMSEDYRLYMLGKCLGKRYEVSSNEDDLEQALLSARAAVAMIPKGSLLDTQARYLVSLHDILELKSERNADPNILLEITQHSKELIDRVTQETPGHKLLPRLLNYHGKKLFLLYRKTNQAEHAEKALINFENAVSSASQDCERAGCMSNLISLLMELFHRTRNPLHLDLAIEIGREATAIAIKHRHKIQDDQGKSLADQASCYEYRYNRQAGEDWVNDMRRSVEATRKALDTIHSKDEYYTNLMVILGGRLYSLYRHDKNPEHSKEATKLLNDALPKIPHKKMQRNVMSNLARLEWAKWQADGKIQHLDNAINFIRQSDSNGWFEATFLWQRARATNSADDLKSGCNVLLERIRDGAKGSLEAADHARYAIRLIEAINFEKCAAEAMDVWILNWKKECIASAIDLLPTDRSGELSLDAQQDTIHRGEGLAANGCPLAARVRDLEQAPKHLEYGRGRETSAIGATI